MNVRDRQKQIAHCAEATTLERIRALAELHPTDASDGPAFFAGRDFGLATALLFLLEDTEKLGVAGEARTRSRLTQMLRAADPLP